MAGGRPTGIRAMNADARVMEFYPAPLTDAESQALMERIREALDNGTFQQFHDTYVHKLDTRI